MKDSGFRVRVERELHEEFMATCRTQGKHAADVMRDFMRAYIDRERGGLQGSLFDRSTDTNEGESWPKRA